MRQFVAPVLLEEVPGWHAPHALWPLEEKKPGVHDTQAWAPICEDEVPAAHALHVKLDLASMAVEKVATPHSMHEA